MNCLKEAVTTHRLFQSLCPCVVKWIVNIFQQTIKVCVVKLSGKIEMYLSNALHSLTKVSG